MPDSFAESLRRGRSGDRASLDELFQRWRPLLRLQARRMLGSDLLARLDPSDVVQESLAQAFADLENFRGQTQCEWVAWLRRIVTGQAAKARRHHRADRRDAGREAAMPDSGAADSAAGPYSVVMHEEQAARLAAAIEELPSPTREIVLRRVFDRQPFEQVAADLGCTAGAARVAWTRALRRLRQHLE